MTSDWTLVEYRPGRYIKVTSTGDYVGKATEAEVKAWFAAQGWWVDPTSTSQVVPDVLEGEAPQTEAGFVAEEESRPEPELIPPGLKAVPIPLTPALGQEPLTEPEPAALVLVVEDVVLESEPISPDPVVEQELPPEPEPSTPSLKVEELVIEAEPASPEPVAEQEPPPEFEPEPITPTLEIEDAIVESGPGPPEPAAEKEPSFEPEPEPPSFDAEDESEPDDIEDPEREAFPVKVSQTSSLRQDPELSQGAENGSGADRWLWVDPRQENGYRPATFDLMAFLSRAVDLFQSKDWTGGQRPGRLAVNPEQATDALRPVAEALDLDVVSDPLICPGTYRLGLTESKAGDGS